MLEARLSPFDPSLPFGIACLQGGGRAAAAPAIAGATTTLRATWVAFLQARPGGALAGGSGMRAQAPFAVAQAVAREHGVDQAMVMVYGRWPASVGRRTHARAPCHAPTSARVSRTPDP